MAHICATTSEIEILLGSTQDNHITAAVSFDLETTKQHLVQVGASLLKFSILARCICIYIAPLCYRTYK